MGLSKIKLETLIYLLLLAVVMIGGYFFLRLAYHVSEPFPFTQEIVLVVLGTITMILITAVLLNKQTEVELKKEESIKFIELKTEIYLELINYVEDLLHKRKLDRDDLIRVQFLSHKLALAASPDVLIQYHSFLEVLKTGALDSEIDLNDSNAISRSLAQLSIAIRRDLLGGSDQQTHFSAKQISNQILRNTEKMINRN